MGWDGFHAFSTISLTTVGKKFLGDISFPTRVSSLESEEFLAGLREILLSAQLQDSVLAMSSSIDWDGVRLSAMMLEWVFIYVESLWGMVKE